MTTIYLCGAINGCTDSEAQDWREATKKALAGLFEFRDPMRRDYRGKEDESVAEIVQGDLDDIADSDIVLVAADKPSWGTAMECFHAHRTGKTVIVVCSGRVSPWLRFHSHRVVPSLFGAWSLLCLPGQLTAGNISGKIA
jgi:nucleoside 2-deoxyribosyltransferase